MKPCKRCNGKGMILNNHKGDSATYKIMGLHLKSGKINSVKGTRCPKCYGKGAL